jgi:arsenite-transporting ATPase
VRTAPYLTTEPIGIDALGEFAETLYAGADPAQLRDVSPLMSWRSDDGSAVLSLDLPLTTRSEVALARSGHDLVVTVGGHRRIVALPTSLAERPVAGATLADGRLSVRFGAEPDLESDGGAA